MKAYEFPKQFMYALAALILGGSVWLCINAAIGAIEPTPYAGEISGTVYVDGTVMDVADKIEQIEARLARFEARLRALEGSPVAYDAGTTPVVRVAPPRVGWQPGYTTATTTNGQMFWHADDMTDQEVRYYKGETPANRF